jgi:hypothetical protein
MVPRASRRADADVPDVGELLVVVTQIDVENERLRLRLLEVLRWMEDAVTAQVACERRVGDLERQAAALQAEIDAIHGTMTWRLLAPLRQCYARLRGRRSHG